MILEVHSAYIAVLMNIIALLSVELEIFVDLKHEDNHDVRSTVVLISIVIALCIIAIPVHYYFLPILYGAYRFGIFDLQTGWERRRDLTYLGKKSKTDQKFKKFNPIRLMIVRGIVLQGCIILSFMYYEIIGKIMEFVGLAV